MKNDVEQSAPVIAFISSSRCVVLYRNVREVLRISFFRRRRAAARFIEHMGTIIIFFSGRRFYTYLYK